MKDNLVRVVCFVVLPFALYFVYLDWQYKNYLKDYRNTQRQEVQTVNEKITTTIVRLRALAEALGEMVGSASKDHQNIQMVLTAGFSLSQHYNAPTIQTISYYKLSDPQEVITPSLVSPLPSVPIAFQKPIKDLKSMTNQNNEMIGAIPVLDKNKQLKGVLEIRVPFVDLQKFIGADKVVTLTFPQLFDDRGKQIPQDKPFDFSYKLPLSYYAYIISHKSYFWTLTYAVLIGSLLLFLAGLIVKKRTGLSYGYQMDQLRKELDSQSSRGSSLEVYIAD